MRRNRWKPTEEDYRNCCGIWIRPKDNYSCRIVPDESAIENPRVDIPLDAFLDIKDFNHVMFSVKSSKMIRIEGIPEQCIPKSQYRHKSMEHYNVPFPMLRGIL